MFSNRWLMRMLKLTGRGSYLNLTPSSHYKFTKNCIAAPGEN